MTIAVDMLIAILVPLTLGLVWLVRLESRTLSNMRGIQRSDKHIEEGQDVKIDIGVLKTNIVDIKEDIHEIKKIMAKHWNDRGKE